MKSVRILGFGRHLGPKSASEHTSERIGSMAWMPMVAQLPWALCVIMGQQCCSDGLPDEKRESFKNP